MIAPITPERSERPKAIVEKEETMKKLVPVFCAGALLFSLAACVGGETPTGSASGSPDPGTSAQEPAGSQSSAGSSSQQADGTAGGSQAQPQGTEYTLYIGMDGTFQEYPMTYEGELDEQGLVFIIFTIEDVKRALCCADNKATKLLRELEKFGLIERKRRGLGKPSLVYVKNFSAESSKSIFQNRDFHDSGGFKNASQDPSKSRCNKTKENDTEMSETDPFYSEESDEMSKRTQLEEFFSQSLEVELLLRLCPDDEDTIYQIVDLLVDTCATKRKMLHVAGDDKPAEVVRSRFMKLNADHIRFVLKCLAENSSPIRNMKQYLLASLYNAPTTMQLSYQNQTNHDLANRR